MLIGASRRERAVAPIVVVGPLASAGQRDKVVALVDEALDSGGKALVGGGARGGRGYFFEPTVVTGVPDTARIRREEVFGPVAPVFPFSDEDEAVAAANDTEYGLVAYVFTENMRRALRVAESIETGMLGLNRGLVSNPAAPFGGVKQSGYGREGGAEGMEEYLYTKYLAIDV